MLVTVPFVLLLLDFWPLRRVTSDQWRVTILRIPVPQLSSLNHLLLEKLPFFALSAVSCVVTYLAQQYGEAVVSTTIMPLGDRLQNAIVSYWLYVDKMLWPAPLAVFYPYSPIRLDSTATAIFVLFMISMMAFLSPRKRPYLTFGWLWYLGMLVPVIGLVQVGAQAMADRYTYVPLIGLFIAIVWAKAIFCLGGGIAGPWLQSRL